MFRNFFGMNWRRESYQRSYLLRLRGEKEGDRSPHARSENADFFHIVLLQQEAKRRGQILDFTAVGNVFKFPAACVGAGKIEAQREKALIAEPACKGDELFAFFVGLHPMAENHAPGSVIGRRQVQNST